MKRQLLWSAALLLTLAACSQEEILFEEQEPEEQIAEESPIIRPEEESGDESLKVTYIQANGGVETKADINDSGKFSWSVGDQIAVYTTSGYKKSAALTSDRIEVIDGVSAATFSFSGDNYLEDADRTDVAVFPASLVFDGTAVRTGHDAAHTVGEGGSLKITLPGSYTRAQVEGTESPRPMIAINAEGSGLAFQSICALLRITVKNIAWDAQSIKVTFPGKKVQGEFTLNNFVVGTNGVTLSGSSDDGDDTITITDLGISEYTPELVINVPIPMGVAGSYEYEKVKVTACDDSTLPINYIVSPLKVVENVPTAWVPGRKSARKVEAALPMFSAYSTKNGEAYAHIANANRRTIVFAPGNLQARMDVYPKKTEKWTISKNLGSADLWRFAEHQYDAIADEIPEDGRSFSYNSKEDPRRGDWIDLFAWIGTDGGIATSTMVDESKNWGIAYNISSGTSSAYGNTTANYELYNDWGELSIQYGEDFSYASNKWHTPTKDEWDLVLNRRYTGSSGYTGIDRTAVKAKIVVSDEKTVCGLIIFPDNYSHPYGAPELVKVHHGASTKWTLADGQAKCADNTLTLEQWQAIEDAGCAFLPFTSTTQFSSAYTILTDYVAEAWYWSATPVGGSKTVPYTVAFNDIEETAGHRRYNTGATTLSATYNGVSRAYGCGVRLTRWVKNE